MITITTYALITYFLGGLSVIYWGYRPKKQYWKQELIYAYFVLSPITIPLVTILLITKKLRK